MICFCAERFHWRRIWQNPGELLLPGLADMATRALLYRRPAEPLDFWSSTARKSIRLGCAGTGARGATPCASIPATAKRSSPCRRAAPSPTPRISRSVTAAGSPRASAGCRRPRRFCRAPWCRCAASRTGSCIAPASRGTVWTEMRDSGERIICVAGGAEHIERRVARLS